MDRITLGIAAALMKASAYQPQYIQVKHWLGHQYPINNKKGFAARDKRNAKNRRGRGR